MSRWEDHGVGLFRSTDFISDKSADRAEFGQPCEIYSFLLNRSM